LFYTDTGFHVLFETSEEHIRAVVNEPNGPVCEDSCVEWFVIPCPGASDEYVNFEVNPIGTLHAAIGKGRHERRFAGDNLRSMIKIKTFIDSPDWKAEINVPFAFFEGLYGKIDFRPGHIMKANFYKCGDELPEPHFVTWNPVGTEQPDYHRPEFFGEIYFQ
ncbi:MAG: carbohydrate-binding family 9-like protein, partial [Prolixibacteraceae bacterium]|nr:carbohydrate-binding family 9-like protein [Prolixibacteraceae bacterium]